MELFNYHSSLLAHSLQREEQQRVGFAAEEEAAVQRVEVDLVAVESSAESCQDASADHLDMDSEGVLRVHQDEVDKHVDDSFADTAALDDRMDTVGVDSLADKACDRMDRVLEVDIDVEHIDHEAADQASVHLAKQFHLDDGSQL